MPNIRQKKKIVPPKRISKEERRLALIKLASNENQPAGIRKDAREAIKNMANVHTGNKLLKPKGLHEWNPEGKLWGGLCNYGKVQRTL